MKIQTVNFVVGRVPDEHNGEGSSSTSLLLVVTNEDGNMGLTIAPNIEGDKGEMRRMIEAAPKYLVGGKLPYFVFAGLVGQGGDNLTLFSEEW